MDPGKIRGLTPPATMYANNINGLAPLERIPCKDDGMSAGDLARILGRGIEKGSRFIQADCRPRQHPQRGARPPTHNIYANFHCRRKNLTT